MCDKRRRNNRISGYVYSKKGAVNED